MSCPTSSPRKGKQKKCSRLQLFNPSHKSEITKLFVGVTPFKLASDQEAEELPKEFDGNVVLNFDVSDDEEDSKAEETTSANNEQETGGKLTCSSCGLIVDDVFDLRQHYKLDWHRYNVKRKIHGQTPVTEAGFSEMMDDLSSIEGSDSEEESTNNDSSTAAVDKLMNKISQISMSGQEESLDAFTMDEKKLAKSPKVYYENENGKIFGLYKSVAEALDTSKNFMKVLENPLKCAVIMVSGGHFVGAVFQGSQVILHKTFHSYTVRAKQGGSQGAKDSKSGSSHPKSAGASLRRYNEQSFAQHVQELTDIWKTQISTCSLIFYRAVGSSSNVLFGGKTPPFQRNDDKLRSIPFPTKRPTFSEAKRVHSLLTVLHIYDNKDRFLSEHLTTNPKISKNKNLQSSPQKKTIDRARSRSPKRRENPVQENKFSSDEFSDSELVEFEEIAEDIDLTHLKEFDDSINAERQTRPKKSKPKKPKDMSFPKPEGVIGCLYDALMNLSSDYETHITDLRNESTILPDDNFKEVINQSIDIDDSNLLHLAAHKNVIGAIWPLLEMGCDPAMKNKCGKFPYNLATSKESRNEFRRFMGQFPEKYDYKKAQIPAPLTEELEAEKAEKKKLLNKIKREKEKQKKQQRQQQEKDVTEKQRFLNLSDREKRALAAEQRILAQCKRNSEKQPVLVRCFECGTDISGLVPFEYSQNVFCTPKCLATHRRKFPTPLSV